MKPSHYADLGIEPLEYIFQNSLGFAEGNVVKYVSRWREKGGIQDLEKAKTYLERLIAEETRIGRNTRPTPAYPDNRETRSGGL